MDGLHYPSVYCSINEENSKNEVLHSKLLRGCTWNIFVKLFYFSCLMAVLWKAPTGFLHEYLTLTSAVKDSSNHSSDKSLWLSVWSIFSPQILQFNKPDFSIKQYSFYFGEQYICLIIRGKETEDSLLRIKVAHRTVCPKWQQLIWLP